MGMIKKGWQGGYKPLDLLFAVIFVAVLYIIILYVALKASSSLNGVTLVYILLYLVSLPLSVWFSVAFWRGSAQSKIVWKWLTRGLVIFVWVDSVLRLVL